MIWRDIIVWALAALTFWVFGAIMLHVCAYVYHLEWSWAWEWTPYGRLPLAVWTFYSAVQTAQLVTTELQDAH